MPHDPAFGVEGKPNPIHKRLEIVAPCVFNNMQGRYTVVYYSTKHFCHKVLFTGTLDECLEFVRENIE